MQPGKICPVVIKITEKKHDLRSYSPGQRRRKHENLQYFKDRPVNSTIETTEN
jgi:hypothetical protein